MRKFLYLKKYPNCPLCKIIENIEIFEKFDEEKLNTVFSYIEQIKKKAIGGNPKIPCEKLSNYVNKHFGYDNSNARDIITIPKCDENKCFEHVFFHTKSIVSETMGHYFNIGNGITKILESDNLYENVVDAETDEETITLNTKMSESLSKLLKNQNQTFANLKEILKKDNF
jgi:hypothetical protein